MGRKRVPGGPTDQGYGLPHRLLRERALARYVPGLSRCARGGEVLYETNRTLLHLDHRDDRAGYLGLSCARHNLQAGGQAAVLRLPRSARLAAEASPGRPW